MKEIKLTKGKVAFVDDEDFERVNCFKWWAVYSRRSDNIWYAKTRMRDTGEKVVCMHRFVLGLPQNKESQVDHKDRNGLNNQKSNLRICSGSQNLGNTGLRKNNTSGFKGVSLRSDHKKWRSNISFHKKVIHLGAFETKELAAKAYDEAAKKSFGEFAWLNFPASTTFAETASWRESEVLL